MNKKRSISFRAMILATSLACIMASCENDKQQDGDDNDESVEAMSKSTPDKQLRHVVMFKFKDSATPGDIKKVEEAFAALPSKIPEISGFEWGTNNSPEGLDKGFTHCFLLTFNSEEARSVYLPHPDHAAFGKMIGPYIDDVLVVDYWNNP